MYYVIPTDLLKSSQILLDGVIVDCPVFEFSEKKYAIIQTALKTITSLAQKNAEQYKKPNLVKINDKQSNILSTYVFKTAKVNGLKLCHYADTIYSKKDSDIITDPVNFELLLHQQKKNNKPCFNEEKIKEKDLLYVYEETLLKIPDIIPGKYMYVYKIIKFDNGFYIDQNYKNIYYFFKGSLLSVESSPHFSREIMEEKLRLYPNEHFPFSTLILSEYDHFVIPEFPVFTEYLYQNQNCTSTSLKFDENRAIYTCFDYTTNNVYIIPYEKDIYYMYDGQLQISTNNTSNTGLVSDVCFYYKKIKTIALDQYKQFQLPSFTTPVFFEKDGLLQNVDNYYTSIKLLDIESTHDRIQGQSKCYFNYQDYYRKVSNLYDMCVSTMGNKYRIVDNDIEFELFPNSNYLCFFKRIATINHSHIILDNINIDNEKIFAKNVQKIYYDSEYCTYVREFTPESGYVSYDDRFFRIVPANMYTIEVIWESDVIVCYKNNTLYNANNEVLVEDIIYHEDFTTNLIKICDVTLCDKQHLSFYYFTNGLIMINVIESKYSIIDTFYCDEYIYIHANTLIYYKMCQLQEGCYLNDNIILPTTKYIKLLSLTFGIDNYIIDGDDLYLNHDNINIFKDIQEQYYNTPHLFFRDVVYIQTINNIYLLNIDSFILKDFPKIFGEYVYDGKDFRYKEQIFDSYLILDDKILKLQYHDKQDLCEVTTYPKNIIYNSITDDNVTISHKTTLIDLQRQYCQCYQYKELIFFKIHDKIYAIHLKLGIIKYIKVNSQ